MQIRKDLQTYIETSILPSYEKNDLGHNLEHIEYVIKRSLNFASTIENIDYDMVYTIAAYHDIGHYIDAKNHEKVSAEMLLADEKLKDFFTDEQIKVMSEAVYDHRSSMKSDRNVSVNGPLKRTYAYRLKHNPDSTLDEIIESSRQHIMDKFGEKGYATEKMYFDDPDYKTFLKEIASLAKDKEKFRERFIKVNNLKG